uniref:Ureide permease 2-like n=1 Tax=Oryza barthii TaxID=65489 RepID=A0A0D3HUT8_9ORYZ
MFVVEDRGGAVALMVASLLFLGTWPALLTLLERRGRLPQHTYLDYSVTNLLAAAVIAIIFGQFGETRPGMPSFFTQLTQDNWPSVLFAMAGGIALSIGNLISQYAWAFVGLSVTNIICSSLAVVLGTTMNYFLDGRINRAEILFPGVACFLVAIFLSSAVHSSNAKDEEDKLSMSGFRNAFEHYQSEFSSRDLPLMSRSTIRLSRGIELSSDVADQGVKLLPNQEELENGEEDDFDTGTAEFIVQVEKRRSIKVFGSSRWLGLGMVLLAGVCFSLFSPAINLATNDQWRTLRDDVPHLTVYTAFFYFSVSCFAVGIGLNARLLYRPVAGVPPSTIGAYAGDWNGRHWALLAGLLCGFGNGFQFMGGQAAGYAAADAVQVILSLGSYQLSNALPLVSTFWGVILFGEYRRSSRRTYLLLGCMLSMFIVAVVLLMASAAHRKTG